MARDNLDRGDEQDMLAVPLLRSYGDPQEDDLTTTGCLQTHRLQALPSH